MMLPAILPHEHVFSRFRGGKEELAAEFLHSELSRAARSGVTDIIDLTAYINPVRYMDLISDVPVRVHACVGFYLSNSVTRTVRGYSAKQLEQGLLRKYARQRAHVSTAALKVAAHQGNLSEFEGNAFRAVAAAHHSTGLPIVTHSPSGGLMHLRLLVSLGVEPHNVMLSHPELELKGQRKKPYGEVLRSMTACLDEGARLCFTDITPLSSSADAVRLALVRELVERGYGDRLVVSGDRSWSVRGSRVVFRGATTEHDPGFLLALDARAKLAALEVKDSDLQRIFQVNSAQFFGLGHERRSTGETPPAISVHP
ncbi:hypothetical protein [Streptomyces sp. AK02-01A]|uniref:phosphotriesterase family protein n=1 Tax=Streptomyces sp. AK02-01A TaxID=3028648 RepID=UPI0029B3CE4F|nr:hypothetical protein [Streptomyces sp. AK02-01A]MDX3849712.1 hypothetical protein [Streptomyces sp. AK02-01A]MDX3849718.1 hypothetical protein [Streptomyces sp. AK02-01A]